jgi:predicted nucleotidyltransferase
MIGQYLKRVAMAVLLSAVTSADGAQAQKSAGIEHLSLFGSTARGGAREESDIDLFFDYKWQKGKVGLFDLVDVKEPSRSSSTMTRGFCQLSAAARLVLPPVPPYERYRGIGSYDGCAR